MNLDNVKYLTIDGNNIVRLKLNMWTVWKGLPSGYTWLDYIETTGTQYIDTGIIPNQNTWFECEFMYLGGSGIYGARTSTASNNFNLRSITINNLNQWQPGYGNKLMSTAVATDNEWHIAKHWQRVVDGNTTMSFFLDDVAIMDFENQTFTAPKSIILGGINASNKVYYGLGRYRACRIYDEFHFLVRDFIPCKDPNGNIGMYDTVNAKFYGNAGTGEFVAGAEL